eukprot:363815-Chlamydomonas_euryale.AAC.1
MRVPAGMRRRAASATAAAPAVCSMHPSAAWLAGWTTPRGTHGRGRRRPPGRSTPPTRAAAAVAVVAPRAAIARVLTRACARRTPA